ncbi:hypothetical protein BWQ96_03302 [Gracilariopsis chorda]|uniref:Uncharacterized protein n=1 Tax=Gracilariopsis chorda TaxID=448386 RepID=A0A2V3IXT6_9FLOR|nr:hypothetical protein BWQ96_03302 [Gracilariopsis chorda]|eukprot:PXF46964.1 hypothetical protein BWQ96_03302 [Gracilariopsis chorda]
MFKTVFDFAFIVFATVSLCKKRNNKGTQNNSDIGHIRCSELSLKLQGRLDGLETQSQQRYGDLERAKEELAAIRIRIWDKITENRKLHEELHRMEAENQQYKERVCKARTEQAGLRNALREIHAQEQACVQMLETRDTSLVSLGRENIALRSGLPSYDS